MKTYTAIFYVQHEPGQWPERIEQPVEAENVPDAMEKAYASARLQYGPGLTAFDKNGIAIARHGASELYHIRHQLGLSQLEMADLLGYSSQSSYSRAENSPADTISPFVRAHLETIKKFALIDPNPNAHNPA